MINHFFIQDPTRWGTVDGLRFGDILYVDYSNRGNIKLDGSERVIWRAAEIDSPVADIWVGNLAGCMEWASQMTPANAKLVAGPGIQKLLHRFLLERLVLFVANGGKSEN